ncbi:hypothetical protein BFN03_03735 [Rhodococcus sp. WMMA185]|nr:hypothetical protein BFN03_03735 [Rhodococcus sp. WMMA185]
MSTGAAGVGSALVTTSPNGVQNVEFRFLSADQSHSDLGDLVRSSISLMTTQVPAALVTPDALAVAYRTSKQAHAIRNAVSRQQHRVHLVPEAAAALAYLRYTGEVAQHTTVAIADFGESGLSVVLVDQVTGAVLHADRTTDVSGRKIDDLIYDHVMGSLPAAHSSRHLDRPLRSARCRVAKEQLSSEPIAHIDLDLQGIRPVEISRTTLDEICAPAVALAVKFIRATIADSPHPPEALALIGGVANIPAIRTGVTDAFPMQVIAVPEPDTATAKGAALLAVSSTIDEYPASGSNRSVSVSKLSGAVVCALVAGALVLGFGWYGLTPPRSPSVFPVGTDNVQATEQVATTTAAPASTAIPSNAPSPTSEHSPTRVARNIVEPDDGNGIAGGLASTSHPTTNEPASITPTVLPAAEATPVLRQWPHIQWPATPPMWPIVPGITRNDADSAPLEATQDAPAALPTTMVVAPNAFR